MEVLWADAITLCADEGGPVETEMMKLKDIRMGMNVGDEFVTDEFIYTLLRLLVRGVRVEIKPNDRDDEKDAPKNKKKKTRVAGRCQTKDT